MSRGSFGRSVARAAASGGGQAYRSRRPGGWYLLLTAIVIVGVALVVYSRDERLHPATTSVNAGPNASDDWNAALAFDICGKLQPALAANTNLASVGIRTFGNGLINIDPGAVTSNGKPANYEGKKATLALFAKSYPGLKLSSTQLGLPVKGQKTWTNGEQCTKSDGPETGAGQVQIKLWSAPTAKGKLTSPDPTGLPLRNGQMITVAFVPIGASIPVPASKSALEALLGTTIPSSSTSSTTASSTTSVPTTTAATATSAPSSSATSTSAASSVSSTTAPASLGAPTVTTAKSTK